MTAIKPEDDLISYRNALGAFTTGVAVVTSTIASKPIGITINSFSSISLKPPLILWSIDEQSSHFDDFHQVQSFAVHILSIRQKAIADRFVQISDDKFSNLEWTYDEMGLPVIPESLARLQCRHNSFYEAGDHRIILGEVLQYHRNEGEPLLFSGGQYHHLGDKFG